MSPGLMSSSLADPFGNYRALCSARGPREREHCRSAQCWSHGTNVTTLHPLSLPSSSVSLLTIVSVKDWSFHPTGKTNLGTRYINGGAGAELRSQPRNYEESREHFVYCNWHDSMRKSGTGTKYEDFSFWARSPSLEELSQSYLEIWDLSYPRKGFRTQGRIPGSEFRLGKGSGSGKGS